ncbi:hypothetical protein [Thiomicrospira pelophila]|uniref:hypothetical protein n=1 Tax=Thiomicrospira pelophila TaxID=934 RepID=UPI0004A6E4AB|nr:hypothetical protein [Thiomicrospira pelophila]
MTPTRAIQLSLLPADAKPVANSHKFLQPSLLVDVKFYQDAKNREYIGFFGCIYFALVANGDAGQALNDYKAKPSLIFDFYQADKDAVPEAISQSLRGSSTLAVCEANTFESTTVKAVFAEKGAWIWPKFGKPDVFVRYQLLYLLARSYNLYAEMQLQKVAQAYDSKDLEKMIDYREAILAFDLKNYYSNPVLIDRHELRQAWPILSKLFELPQVHDEMKTQVQDLSDLITAKQHTAQNARYKRMEIAFWIIGAGVGLVALF